MRSRYSAFALGKGEYLLQTLAQEHADRQMSASELGHSRHGQRFLDLCILHEQDLDPNTAEVLFYARLFERGADHSFIELSRFVREESGWRYQRGDLLPASAVEGDPRQLTRERFETLRPSV